MQTGILTQRPAPQPDQAFLEAFLPAALPPAQGLGQKSRPAKFLSQSANVPTENVNESK